MDRRDRSPSLKVHRTPTSSRTRTALPRPPPSAVNRSLNHPRTALIMLASLTVSVETNALEDSGFESWRNLARAALIQNLFPGEIDFIDSRSDNTLRLNLPMPSQSAADFKEQSTFHVPRQFLDTASKVACHRDPSRWNLLYRILWRLQSDKRLLHIDSDPDIAQ